MFKKELFNRNRMLSYKIPFETVNIPKGQYRGVYWWGKNIPSSGWRDNYFALFIEILSIQ